MASSIALPVFETVITILLVPGLAVICMYVLLPLRRLLSGTRDKGDMLKVSAFPAPISPS
jgi:hypothetical protein